MILLKILKIELNLMNKCFQKEQLDGEKSSISCSLS